MANDGYGAVLRRRAAVVAHHGVPACITVMIGGAILALGLADGGYGVVPRQTAGVLLWWTVALATLMSGPLPRSPSATGLAVLGLSAAMAVWIAVDPGTTSSRPRTIEEFERAIVHLAPIVLLGWLLPQRLWRAAFAGLVVGAVGLTVVALTGRLFPSPQARELAASVPLGGNGRLRDPLGYWNAVGAWAVITTLVLLAASAHAASAWQRILSLGLMPTVGTVVYLTYSRSAIGALALGVVVLLGLARNRWTVLVHGASAAATTAGVLLAVRASPEIATGAGTAGASRVVATLLVASVAAGAVAVLYAKFGLDRVRLSVRTARVALAIGTVAIILWTGMTVQRHGGDAWREFTTSAPMSTNGSVDPSNRLTNLNGTRINLWRAVLETWPEHRWTGTGAGTTELTVNENTKTGAFAKDAHSLFIETLTEQGIIGLLLLIGFVAAVGAAVGSAMRRRPETPDRGLVAGAAAACAAFLVGASVDWLWETTALALLVMGLVGMIVRAGHDQSSRRVPVSMASRGLKPAIALTATLLALSALPGLVGTAELQRSQRAVESGDLQEARHRADRAITAYPWASAPLIQRALVDERQRQWQAGRRALRLAIERDPNDWRPYLILSRIEAKAGRPAPAVNAFRVAKGLRPRGRFAR